MMMRLPLALLVLLIAPALARGQSREASEEPKTKEEAAAGAEKKKTNDKGE